MSMDRIQKAIEITDAKIQFVSLVDKAANKRQFLVTKCEDGQARFATYGKIVKVDADAHYITGIVYEPMVEDAHGNYMTGEEIRKAAYWFAKNGDKVDLQHSFEKAAGLSVVENYVAPSDLLIGETAVARGSWVITVECTDEAIWQAVQKGELTGFSMGGVGKYSEEDVTLEAATKGGSAEQDEKAGLLKRLGKFLGLEPVEKGAVLDRYNAEAKDSAFWNAMWALEDVLYHYNYMTDRREFAADETEIRSALEDFNRILTAILADSSVPVIKAVALPVEKAGRKMSGANKAKLDEICQALSDFKSSFDETEEEEDEAEEEEDTGKKTPEKEKNVQKEDTEMNRAETEALVSEAIAKALTEAGVLKAAPAAEKPAAPQGAPEADVRKQGEPGAPAAGTDMEAMVAKAAEGAVKKALLEAGLIEEVPDPNAPVTKAEIEQIVNDALAPMMKAFRLPQNLNDAKPVEKGGEAHYLHGIL